jgi:hypothetical protein
MAALPPMRYLRHALPRPQHRASRIRPEVCFVILTVVKGEQAYIRAITDPVEAAKHAPETFSLSGIDGVVFRPVHAFDDATAFGNMEIISRVGQLLRRSGFPFGTRSLTVQLRDEVVS